MVGRFKKALLEKGGMSGMSQKSGDMRPTEDGAGMSQQAVRKYRRRKPGSKLQTAVTTPPSKLKAGSKAAKRRKSFCARSRSWSSKRGKAARRRWNCSTDVNPNALQAMSEAVYLRVFESQLDERIVSLLECAVDSVDQVTDEMIEDALTIESILTPIVFEEFSNPLNESVEDFDEVIIRRFDEAINPAAIRVPAAYGARGIPSFKAGLKRATYDAASKAARGLGGAAYDATSKVGRGLGGAAYDATAAVGKGLGGAAMQGAKNFYQGLSGDTPIGTRIGKTIRGGLSGLRRGFTKYGTPEGEGGGIGAATGRGLRRAGQAIKSGIGKAFQAYKDTQTKPFGAEMERAPQKPTPEEPKVMNQAAFDARQKEKAEEKAKAKKFAIADKKQGVMKDKATGRRLTPTVPGIGVTDANRAAYQRTKQSNQDIMRSAVGKAAKASLTPKPSLPKVPSDAAAQAANAPNAFRDALGQQVRRFRTNLANARGSRFSTRNPIAKQYMTTPRPGAFTPRFRDVVKRFPRGGYFPRPKL